MQNLLFHIDTRRIHGQIVAGWGFQAKIQRFVLADDEVAADDWERTQYAETPGREFETLVLSIAEAVRKLKELGCEKKTMLITSSPHDALRMLELDLQHDLITVGNLDPGAGKQQLSSSVSISDQDRQDLRRIIQRGVRVVIQSLPQDKPVAVMEIIEAQ